jgi:hypothetical protein
MVRRRSTVRFRNGAPQLTGPFPVGESPSARCHHWSCATASRGWRRIHTEEAISARRAVQADVDKMMNDMGASSSSPARTCALDPPVWLTNVLSMGGLVASAVVIAAVLGVLLVVAFDIFCLVHLAVTYHIPFLAKLAWAALIVCVSPIGGALYLLCQRQLKRPPDSRSGRAGAALM